MSPTTPEAQREPILAVDEDFEPEPEDDFPETVATNDEWVFRKADRLVGSLPRHAGRDDRTEGEVFDHHTLMVLHRFLAHGVLRSLDFPVSTGKEANVFRGTTPGGAFVAVKIYRVNTATFKHVMQYIDGDERFEGVGGDRRSLVTAWCQKEFRNLLRMREAGCQVPEPIRNLQNVLVTEFLGKAEGAWPRLHDCGRLDDPRRIWEALVDDYARAFSKAQLVHADLSAFNILVERVDEDQENWHPRIIDVGQAVLRSHPMAREFLERDIRNLTGFFRRQKAGVTEADMRERLGVKAA